MTPTSTRYASVALLGFLLSAACGGSVELSPTSSVVDGGLGDVDASSSQDGSANNCEAAVPRAPLKHRPTATSCPHARGPANPTEVTQCASCVGESPSCLCDCTMDSDCDEGPNGRCGAWIPPPVLDCSYDECFGDSDCDGGVPCECRPSAESSAPNACIGGGNCRVDSDCGPGGYCSPSLLTPFCACMAEELCGDAGGACYVGSSDATGMPPGPGWTEVPCVCGDACGHGYFCHTGCDACLDDSDCAAGTCNYNTLRNRWECASPACT